MNNNSYNQTGTYLGIAGILVQIATHFGYNVTTDQAVLVIGGLVTIFGIVYQAIQHKKLAVSTGTIPPPQI